MDKQIYVDDKLIHPQTRTDLIIHGNTTAKDILDNASPVVASAFGHKILNAQSFAEVCRLLHHNYTFAEDTVDGVKWTIIGAPSADSTHAATGTALHATNGNYIYRKLNFGADDFNIEFDLYCDDINKIFFQIFDNTALPATNTPTAARRNWYRLCVDNNGYLNFKYIYQISRDYNSSAAYYQWDWGNAAVTSVNISSNKILAGSITHIKIAYTHTLQRFYIYADGQFLLDGGVAVASKNWLVYLGYSADCYIDNFSMDFVGVDLSGLDFE